MIHDYKLRPYHNPECVDESKVPDGWRFRYADEYPLPDSRSRYHDGIEWVWAPFAGTLRDTTYIVPV